MPGPFDIIAGVSPYFSAPLMGNYNGNVIGTSNLAVQNIYSVPSPQIKCQVKQPFSATANENLALNFYSRQPEGIEIACERQKRPVRKDVYAIPSSFGKPSVCDPCCLSKYSLEIDAC